MQAADLSGLAVSDMEVGPDDKVYVSSGNMVYRIEAGAPVVHAALPADAASITLDASSWGLVALDSANGVFYRIEADGAASPFYSLGHPQYGGFALDPQGTVCYSGEGWECRRQDGSYDFPPLSGDSMAFSPGGIMYVSTWDNVYKLEGTPLGTLIKV